MSKKFIEVSPVCTVIFSSLSYRRLMSSFLSLSKELPEVDRITACPSSQYNFYAPLQLIEIVLKMNTFHFNGRFIYGSKVSPW